MRFGSLCLFCVWMNILHLVTAKKENSPALEKLKASCKDTATCPVSFPKQELKERLTPEQYRVTQERGTERFVLIMGQYNYIDPGPEVTKRPYTGKHLSNNDEGSYRCVVCGNRIFSSDDKFNAHCGWPAFSKVLSKEHVTLNDDFSHGMQRIEVTCARCGAHLGHLFDDGPPPTGKRYCINSAALEFNKHPIAKQHTETDKKPPKVKSEL